MMEIAQLFVRLSLGLLVCLAIQDGALARENFAEISESCEKGMSQHAAVSPYPYPLVYLDNENGVTGQFLCDTNTSDGGWLVIQRRTNGLVSFDVEWEQYKHGFGSLSTDYWMGLETIHNLTSSGRWELLYYTDEHKGRTSYSRYTKFKVDSEKKRYRLYVDNYQSGASTHYDAMTHFNGENFYTKDRDNFADCSVETGGGWWFTSMCKSEYLNSLWTERVFAYNRWNTYQDYDVTEMKIRRLY